MNFEVDYILQNDFFLETNVGRFTKPNNVKKPFVKAEALTESEGSARLTSSLWYLVLYKSKKCLQSIKSTDLN